MSKFEHRKILEALRKLGALLFLVAIVLIPLVIVTLGSSLGGIFILGYVTGIITLPMVAIGAIRAIHELTESITIEDFFGAIVFGSFAILVSVAAAFWSIFFSAP